MMKTILLSVLTVFIFCQSCKTLTSTTYIEPQKSFVLGEGAHGSYTATVENVGTDQIEVIQINNRGEATTLGTLKVGQKNTYTVPDNTTINFKNSSINETGTIKILAKGDTNLSMGYKENK
jgi:hypothetical protein